MNLDTITMYTLFIFTLVIFSSTAEWWIHKYPAHKKKFAKFPILGPWLFADFGREHFEHHREFSGKHYLCSHHDHHHESLRLHHAFAILSAIAVASPFLVLECLTSFANHLTIIATLFAYCYYWTLEFLHAGYHKALGPQYGILKRLKIFQYVATHHENHHKRLGTNFNLVVVVADYIFGTKADASQVALCTVRIFSGLAIIGFAVSYFVI